MTCNVILTSENGRFLAHVAELPHCKAEAKSRDRALELIQQRLAEVARRSEVVKLEIPNLEGTMNEGERNGAAQPPAKTVKPPKLVQLSPMVLADDKTVQLETPWEYFGIFKDDPTWMPMLEDIERRRDRQKIPGLKKKNKKGKK